ncbi:hypothetical protein [Actinokineospora enzanensis]|uniref:hypothetical protein n=1 Tax=Actinokineospora enzanensis TaxID=155975 RepID=UPI00037557C2|nr:hypothetical protein [Actinokineospora enzanensis]
MLFPWLWVRSTGFPFAWLDELACPELLSGSAADFDRAVVAARRALVARMTGPDVAEALLLSNVAAVDRIGALADADLEHPNVRIRQRLRLAWSYLQRFCAKNETCSFFGPLAWGVVDPRAERSLEFDVADPAAGRLRRRRVRVEHWVVRGLCAGVARSAGPYRLHPGCDVDDAGLRVPVGKRIALPDGVAGFLRSVQAGAAVGEPPRGASRLVEAGVLTREVAVPPESSRGPLGIEDVVGSPVPLVTRLEELRSRFERQTTVDARRSILGELDALLVSAGVDGTRSTGTMYAGRLPVYEDCERNLLVRVGGALAGVLRDQLPPLLRLHRLVAECAASELHRHYAAVAAVRITEEGVPDADFLAFLRAARADEAIGPVRSAIAADLRAVMDRAWSDFGWHTEEVLIEDSHLATVAAALRSRYPEHARFASVLGVGVMSPDVLVAEGSTVVLGEVHPCVPAAVQSVALPFLDDAAAALAVADRLLGGDRMVLAVSDTAYQRSLFTWPVTPGLAEVVVPGATSRCPPDRTIPAGRGRVRLCDGLVLFVDRHTGRTEDMVSVLSSDLQHIVFAVAGAVLGGDLQARLRYGDVVVRRRSWSPDPTTLPDAARPSETHTDYQALLSWAHAHDLPRRCFLRTDTEPKPVYVDWANPIAVDTFARLARAAGRIRVTELSPTPDCFWLTDDLGTHGAELRLSYSV